VHGAIGSGTRAAQEIARMLGRTLSGEPRQL
jgi:hypothetical protein